MLQVSSTDFQMHFSQMMKLALEEEGGIIITNHGVASLKVVALESPKKDTKNIYGCMKGTGKTLGDIVNPVYKFVDL